MDVAQSGLLLNTKHTVVGCPIVTGLNPPVGSTHPPHPPLLLTGGPDDVAPGGLVPAATGGELTVGAATGGIEASCAVLPHVNRQSKKEFNNDVTLIVENGM
jgi:hypothetical protein